MPSVQFVKHKQMEFQSRTKITDQITGLKTEVHTKTYRVTGDEL